MNKLWVGGLTNQIRDEDIIYFFEDKGFPINNLIRNNDKYGYIFFEHSKEKMLQLDQYYIKNVLLTIAEVINCNNCGKEGHKAVNCKIRRSASPIIDRSPSPLRKRDRNDSDFERSRISEKFSRNFREFFSILNNPHTWEFNFRSKFSGENLFLLERWFNNNCRFLENILGINILPISLKGLNNIQLNNELMKVYSICFSASYKLRN